MENQEQIVNSVSELTQEQRVNAFAEAIKRSTSQIKADRALEVSELLELEMKREVEDRTRDVKLLERKKKSALDMSPDNTYSIIKVKDFEPQEFSTNYNAIGLAIREAKIKLNNSMQSYNELFGQTYTLLNID